MCQSKCTLFQVSDSDLAFASFVHGFKFYIEGVGILVVGLVGLVINVFALYILFRKQVLTFPRSVLLR